MGPTKVQMLKARALSIKTALDAVPLAAKKEHISTTLAKNFNSVVDEVAAAFPELKDSLPKHCESTVRLLTSVGKANDTYLDLEVFAEQLIQLLDLVNVQE